MYTIANLTKTIDWSKNEPVTIYHFEFGFTSKEQYLEETAGWKAEYKELSARIRKYKSYRKPKNRPEGMEGYRVYSTLDTMQEQARIMCAMRVQAKVAAGRQMVAQRKAA